MTTPLLCFDIETSGADNALELFEPQFEPDARLKDPDKVAESIAEKRAKWVEDCALRAERGRVLAIGWTLDGKQISASHSDEYDGNESALLTEWLYVMSDCQKAYTFAGFNILNFDLPFIRRRCLVLGIPFPFHNREDKWRPWTVKTYDAMEDWNSRVYGSSISLDAIARGLGVGKKTGHGSDFAELYRTDREAALGYLRNDVQLTWKVCERMLA